MLSAKHKRLYRDTLLSQRVLESAGTRGARSAKESLNSGPVDRGNHVAVIYADAVGSIQKKPSNPQSVYTRAYECRARMQGAIRKPQSIIVSAFRLPSVFCLLFSVLCLLSPASPSHAEEAFSLSGRLSALGVEALDAGSIREYPDLDGRIRMDASVSSWRFHSWLEGGWDGTVRRPIRDHDLFKNYDEVYQSNTPYLEFKELYATYPVGELDLRAGVQRFAWGRLDEYPPNDLLNPWDYTRFLRKPLEERKIGVPSVSAAYNKDDWTFETAWVPVSVPYRLPMPYERWFGSSIASNLLQAVPNAQIVPGEPDLPERTIENSNVGIRLKHAGDIEWALNLFHGYDPRPVFKTTALTIIPQAGSVLIDPGFVPDFHRISSVGMDAAAVRGDLSLRGELAYSFNRYLNIRRELWGYPAFPSPGINPLNPSIEQKHDTLDYGIGADYRLFEDGMLTVQAQQTVIFGNVDVLYARKVETLLWGNLRAGFMNQKIDTNFNIAYNPEHGDRMSRATGWYIFSDAWKAGITYVAFTGPEQSLFGSYSRNDQLEADVIYSW